MKLFGVVTTAVVFLAFATVTGFAQQQEEKPARQDQAKPQHPEHERQIERPQQKAEPKSDPRAQQENEKRAEEDAKHAQDNDRRAQQQEQKRAEQDNRHAQDKDQKRAQQDQQHTQEQQQRQAREAQKAQEQNAKAEHKAREEEQKRAQHDRDRQARDQREHPGEHGQRPDYAGNNRHRGRIPEDRFRAHFGREHVFRFSRPVIIDNRPRFQYSGYWFELVDPWPVGWSYDDEVYVDYVGDEYYLYDPVHPGVSVIVNVIQ
jgi:hypothetical protein